MAQKKRLQQDSSKVAIPVVNGMPTQSTTTSSKVPNINNRHFTSKRFADAPISELSKGAIRHEYLTDVQAATLMPALSGHDLLVQAKTGTGKTLAFLVPAIERLVASPLTSTQMGRILVISPTWELAHQIQEEATPILERHSYRGQSITGRTKKINLSSTDRIDILFATPGRLLDYLNSGLILKPMVLILDEADTLLDKGFRVDLKAILKHLPDITTRQNMMFSATFNKGIKEIAELYLHPEYKFISTLHDDEINTHEHVPQHYLITPLERTLPTLVSLLEHTGPQVKTMVFCTTARGAAAVASILQQVSATETGPTAAILPPIHQIHSRMSQAARTRAAKEFRDASEGILVASDLAARGMDFGGVTHVIQFSIPPSSELYIHRLGRTARAGAGGTGILLLTTDEELFLNLPEIKTLPLKPLEGFKDVRNQLDIKLDEQAIAQAYAAWLGYYNNWRRKLGWSPEKLVEQGAVWARCLGWQGTSGGGVAGDQVGRATWIPPPILKLSVKKMGLQSLGLNVVNSLDHSGNPSVQNGGAGRGRGRGRGRGQPPQQPHIVDQGHVEDTSVPKRRAGRGRGRGRQTPVTVERGQEGGTSVRTRGTGRGQLQQGREGGTSVRSRRAGRGQLQQEGGVTG